MIEFIKTFSVFLFVLLTEKRHNASCEEQEKEGEERGC